MPDEEKVHGRKPVYVPVRTYVPTSANQVSTPDGLTLIAEFHDSDSAFAWRIKIIDNKHPGNAPTVSEWTNHYAGVLVLQYGNRKFGLATQYWDAILKAEEVFEIVEFNRV